MTFGKRLQRQEMTSKFIGLCDDMNINLKERREELSKLEDDLQEYEYYDQETVNKIRFRLDSLKVCPNCEGDFLYDDENDEDYCPVCEE